MVGRKPISLLYIVGIESLIDMPCLLFWGLLERAQEDPNLKTYTSTKRKHECISKVKGEGAVRINNYPDILTSFINMISSEIFLE